MRPFGLSIMMVGQPYKILKLCQTLLAHGLCVQRKDNELCEQNVKLFNLTTFNLAY